MFWGLWRGLGRSGGKFLQTRDSQGGWPPFGGLTFGIGLEVRCGDPPKVGKKALFGRTKVGVGAYGGLAVASFFLQRIA